MKVDQIEEEAAIIRVIGINMMKMNSRIMDIGDEVVDAEAEAVAVAEITKDAVEIIMVGEVVVVDVADVVVVIIIMMEMIFKKTTILVLNFYLNSLNI